MTGLGFPCLGDVPQRHGGVSGSEGFKGQQQLGVVCFIAVSFG